MGIKSNWKKISDLAARYGTFAAVVIITIGFMIFVPRFGTVSNIKTLLVQVSMLAIVAVGLTTVFAVGELDISTGSLVSLSGIVSAYLMTIGLSSTWAILITLFLGLMFGLTNGLIVGYLRVPALLGTFSTSMIALGMNYWIGNGVSIRVAEEITGKFFITLGSGMIFGAPIPFLIAAVIIFIFFMLMEKTKWGLRMYAVGGNREAATVFGINNRLMKLIAFILCGLTASIAGLILAARLGSGSPIAGDQYTLDAIAAVYVGVSMFREGEPHVPGTILGVLIFGILVNGMRLLGVGYEPQIILRGIFILMAVAIAGNRAQFRVKLF